MNMLRINLLILHLISGRDAGLADAVVHPLRHLRRRHLPPHSSRSRSCAFRCEVGSQENLQLCSCSQSFSLHSCFTLSVAFHQSLSSLLWPGLRNSFMRDSAERTEVTVCTKKGEESTKSWLECINCNSLSFSRMSQQQSRCHWIWKWRFQQLRERAC